jgi:hypothetical protein
LESYDNERGAKTTIMNSYKEGKYWKVMVSIPLILKYSNYYSKDVWGEWDNVIVADRGGGVLLIEINGKTGKIEYINIADEARVTMERFFELRV